MFHVRLNGTAYGCKYKCLLYNMVSLKKEGLMRSYRVDGGEVGNDDFLRMRTHADSMAKVLVDMAAGDMGSLYCELADGPKWRYALGLFNDKVQEVMGRNKGFLPEGTFIAWPQSDDVRFMLHHILEQVNYWQHLNTMLKVYLRLDAVEARPIVFEMNDDGVRVRYIRRNRRAVIRELVMGFVR